MTIDTKIDFFDSILSSSRKHPDEVYSWLGKVVQWYFNFGQNAYKIDSRTRLNNGCIPVVREIYRQNIFLTALKVFFIGITTLTVIIPVMMLVCLKFYRSQNRFVLIKIPSDNLNQKPNSNEKNLIPNLTEKKKSSTQILKQSLKLTPKQKSLQNLKPLERVFSEKNVVNKVLEFQKKIDLLPRFFDLTVYKEICFYKKILQEFIDHLEKNSEIPLFLEKAHQDLKKLHDSFEKKFIANLESENFSFIISLKSIENTLKSYSKISEIPEKWIESYIKSIEFIQKIVKSEVVYSRYYDVEFYKKIYDSIVPRGIPNIGNSCYMNSGLQVLVGISFFRNLIASKTWKPCIIYSKLENESEDDQIKRIEKDEIIFKETVSQYEQIHSNFQTFLNAYLEGLSLENSAKKFRSALYKAKLIEGKKTSQQDAEIFFRTLISASGYTVLYRRRLISDAESGVEEFKFHLDSQPSFTISMKELEESDIFSLSFQELINLEFSEKNLELDDPYLDKGYSKESYKYEEAPDYLILNIKRFGNDLKKYNEKFIFENGEVIDFSAAMNKEVLEQSDRTDFLYEPIGMIQHHGNTREYGHYTADVKKNGLWFHCNDSQIKKVGLINPNLGNGYIYCFKRMNL